MTHTNGATTGRAGRRAGRRLVAAAVVLFVVGGVHDMHGFASAQPMIDRAAGPPFEAGEVLEFQVRSSRFGDVGSGRMSVDGPVEIRGRRALLLSMDIEGRVALFGFSDRTRSWYDPVDGASLRFEKMERHPLARREEAVDLLVGEGRWRDAEGRGGPLATPAPLDELSVLYVLRTLKLEAHAEHTLDRHFDEERNPIRVRTLGIETIRVPAGEFQALAIELEVRDPRRYDEGAAVIRIHLTDDTRRLPLRIESTAPMVGTLVLSLRSWTPGPS